MKRQPIEASHKPIALLITAAAAVAAVTAAVAVAAATAAIAATAVAVTMITGIGIIRTAGSVSTSSNRINGRIG